MSSSRTARPTSRGCATLCDELVKLGLRAFLDERELETGENWTLRLSRELHQSRALALVISAAGAGTPVGRSRVDLVPGQARADVRPADPGPARHVEPAAVPQAHCKASTRPTATRPASPPSSPRWSAASSRCLRAIAAACSSARTWSSCSTGSMGIGSRSPTRPAVGERSRPPGARTIGSGCPGSCSTGWHASRSGPMPTAPHLHQPRHDAGRAPVRAALRRHRARALARRDAHRPGPAAGHDPQ